MMNAIVIMVGAYIALAFVITLTWHAAHVIARGDDLDPRWLLALPALFLIGIAISL